MESFPDEDVMKTVKMTAKDLEYYTNLVDKAVSGFGNIDLRFERDSTVGKMLSNCIVSYREIIHERKNQSIQQNSLSSYFKKFPWRRKWQPTPVFLPGESHGWRSWWATVHGVAKSRIWLSDFTFTFNSQLRLSALVFAIECFLEFSKTCDHIFFKLPLF